MSGCGTLGLGALVKAALGQHPGAAPVVPVTGPPRRGERLVGIGVEPHQLDKDPAQPLRGDRGEAVPGSSRPRVDASLQCPR